MKRRMHLNIFLNGQPHQTKASNLDQLCLELGHSEVKVATALNGEFVPQNKRLQTALNENDKIEILSPRQGG